MKRLFNILMVALAANFLLLAGAMIWLVRSGHLDRQKLSAIKEIIFAPPAAKPPTTRPASPPTTQPGLELETLLAKYAGRPPAQQLEYIRTAFDAQKAQLELAQRSLQDLQRQVLAEKQQLAADRAALEAGKKKLLDREQETVQLALDKGFQDSLALYESLPGKSVKTVFMSLDDATVVRYLRAMEPRAAAKIVKEFKTPQETERLKQIMERMRLASATTQPSGPQASAKE